jgi:transposase
MLRQSTPPTCCLGCCPTRPRCRPAAMLFGLEAEFRILSARRIGTAAVTVVVEQVAREGSCPTCGGLSGKVKDRPLRRIKDLSACGQTLQLWWRKRRLLCGESLCPRRSFTQAAVAVRPRGRLTERLRDKVASAIAGSNRSVADVASEYGVKQRSLFQSHAPGDLQELEIELTW